MTVPPGELHASPPLTPVSFLARRPRSTRMLALLLIVLAIGAAIDHGAVLLLWDEPIQRAVESWRSGWLDSCFLAMSRLGGTAVVLSVGTVAVLATWRRCRSVSIAIFVAMLSRPLLEFTLKAVVGRARPDFDRLVDGQGHSFPSGHVMAAVALWGLLPMITPLFTRRRTVWWASVVISGVLIVSIAASRVYLGVHWFSDVTGGLLIGAFFLVGVEHLLTRLHRGRPCHCAPPDLADGAVDEPGEDARALVGAASP